MAVDRLVFIRHLIKEVLILSKLGIKGGRRLHDGRLYHRVISVQNPQFDPFHGIYSEGEHAFETWFKGSWKKNKRPSIETASQDNLSTVTVTAVNQRLVFLEEGPVQPVV